MATSRRSLVLDRESFEGLVAEALAGMPEWFRQRLENIEIIVEEEPDPGILRGMGVPRGGTLLGLYQGVPLLKRGHGYGNVLPDRIVIYMGPILRSPEADKGLKELVREVVYHEVGHYFGLTEEELRRLENGE